MDICKNDINLMPFSIGKRYCLGQSLAEKELFLFIVGLIKAFEILPQGSEKLPDCDYDAGSKIGLIRGAPLYKVVLNCRKN